MPQISIIVPVYNVEKYLERCIDSLINQTFKDIEIILIDDGSTDKSPQICDEYAGKDTRIRVVHRKNQGPSATRNYALKLAQSEFIGFVDSDDFIKPETYEIALKHMKPDIDLVLWKVNVVSDDDLAYTEWFAENYFKHRYSEKIELTEEIRKLTAVVPWNKLFRKSIIDENKITFPEGRLYEDNAFWWKYTLWCKNVYFTEEKLHFYNMRVSSLRGDVINKKTELEVDRIYMVEDVYNHYVENNLYDNDNKELLGRLFLTSFTDAYDETEDKNTICSLATELAIKMNLKDNFDHMVKNLAESLIKKYVKKPVTQIINGEIKSMNNNYDENEFLKLVHSLKYEVSLIEKGVQHTEFDMAANQKHYENAINCYEQIIHHSVNKYSIQEEVNVLKDFIINIPSSLYIKHSDEAFGTFLETLQKLYEEHKTDTFFAFCDLLQMLYPSAPDLLRIRGDAYYFILNDSIKAFHYYKKYTDIIKNNELVYDVMADICKQNNDDFHQIIYKQKASKARLGLA